MNPDSIPQEFNEQVEVQAQSISYRLQDVIGRCMSLEADMLKEHFFIEASFVEAAKVLLNKAAARLEIPLVFRQVGEAGEVKR